MKPKYMAVGKSKTTPSDTHGSPGSVGGDPHGAPLSEWMYPEVAEFINATVGRELIDLRTLKQPPWGEKEVSDEQD